MRFSCDSGGQTDRIASLDQAFILLLLPLSFFLFLSFSVSDAQESPECCATVWKKEAPSQSASRRIKIYFNMSHCAGWPFKACKTLLVSVWLKEVSWAIFSSMKHSFSELSYNTEMCKSWIKIFIIEFTFTGTLRYIHSKQNIHKHDLAAGSSLCNGQSSSALARSEVISRFLMENLLVVIMVLD